VSALIFTSPLFTFILSYLFLQENITLASLSGVVFIILGTLLLTYS
jgi:drug/metabolite transporter (DMT)-like permease